jgi:tRNA(adenine34) deaminase
MTKEEVFMDCALAQARIALENNEVPVGAVIVDEHDVIIAQAHNKTESSNCQAAHAEVLAIKKACSKRGDWRLNDCMLYVTLEPCLMCFGLIGLSRIKGIVFGANSPLFGCGLDNKEAFPVYKKDLLIRGGYKREECIVLLQRFFQGRRK